MSNKALTMFELMLVIGLLAFALTGLLISYVSSLNLSEYDKNLTIAMNVAREKMEELYKKRDESFDTLGSDMCLGEPSGCSVVGDDANRVISFNNAYMKTKYNNFNGSCTIYIKEIDPQGDDLKEARVLVCWRQRIGRIVGEDLDLDGQPDTTEYEGGVHTDELDSPCEIEAAFAKR